MLPPAGKGLGLAASRDLLPGQLLLVCEPLALLQGAAGSIPANAALAAALAAEPLGPLQQQWLRILLAGEAPGGTAERLQQARQLLQEGNDHGNSGAGPAAETAAAVVAAAPAPADADGAAEAALLDFVARNCYGEAQEDVAVCSLRQVTPESYLGVWPEACLLNHACAPNTAWIKVGRAMLLHAARPVRRGAELSACYLGRERFLHVAQRRALLAARYGFHCRCERCVAEQALFPTVSAAASDAAAATAAAAAAQQGAGNAGPRPQPQSRQWQGWLQRLRDGNGAAQQPNELSTAVGDRKVLAEVNAALDGDLAEAMAAAVTTLTQPRERQRRVWDSAQALMARVDAALEQAAQALAAGSMDDALLPAPSGDAASGGAPPSSTSALLLQLQAAAYPLYAQSLDFVEATGVAGGDPAVRLQLLQTCQRLLSAVAPGSDMHVTAAVRAAMAAAAQAGPDAPEARQAALEVALAHTARYGRDLGQPLLADLGAVRRGLLTSKSLASRLAMARWQEAVEAEGESRAGLSGRQRPW